MALPFMPGFGGGAAPEDDELRQQEAIVADLLASVQQPAPEPRQQPRVGQVIAGGLSDALRAKATVLAGGLPQEGPFARQMRIAREEDEADRRDVIKANRDVQAQIRIGVAQGRIRRIEALSDEAREQKQREQERLQGQEDALNNLIVTKGIAAKVEGDFRKLPFEKRVKLLAENMGATTPTQVVEEYMRSGLADRFRLERIEPRADGTFMPVLKSIKDEKEERDVQMERLLFEAAQSGVPPENLMQIGKSVGLKPEKTALLGEISSAVTEKRTRQARADFVDGFVKAKLDEGDPSAIDYQSDLAPLNALIMSGAPFEDVAKYYAVLVNEARSLIEEGSKTSAEMQGYLRQMRALIRRATGYDIPDVASIPLGKTPKQESTEAAAPPEKKAGGAGASF